MAAFPEVILSTPFVGQKEYSADRISITKQDDDLEAKTLRVFCQLGEDPSFKYWVTVLNGDNYTVDWTNQQVLDAVTAFFTNPT